jgi:hypothetical protein
MAFVAQETRGEEDQRSGKATGHENSRPRALSLVAKYDIGLVYSYSSFPYVHISIKGFSERWFLLCVGF